MTIGEWLIDATKQLKRAQITSNRLDAELILAHTLNKSRTYLHGHIDDEIDSSRRDIADARLAMRCERTPVAYLIGHKEFYGRRFKVTPATLIPRPESESMIELLLKLTESVIEPKDLVDVGTGSGCLGITAKLERPQFSVVLTDVSNAALAVARTNAMKLGAEITTLHSNLLELYPGKADYFLANLPYVDTRWERSPETDHEPSAALFADDSGMALIKSFFEQLPAHCKPNAHVVIEADPSQHDELITFAAQLGFDYVTTDWYCFVLRWRG